MHLQFKLGELKLSRDYQLFPIKFELPKIFPLFQATKISNQLPTSPLT